MSLVQTNVNVCGEVNALLGLVVTAIADVKAGKGALQVGSDLLPLLVTALGNVGQLQSEIADRKDLERTVALKLCDIVDAVVPAPVVAKS